MKMTVKKAQAMLVATVMVTVSLSFLAAGILNDGGNSYQNDSGAVLGAPYSGGSGAEGDPYLISTLADLNALSSAVYGGDSMSDVWFRMTGDISIPALSPPPMASSDPGAGTMVYSGAFLPIGFDSRPFRGVFDGNGFSITDLTDLGYITNVSSQTTYMGLFGYVGAGGVVMNLNMASTCAVTMTVAGPTSDTLKVGAVIGANKGTVDGCINYGSVTVDRTYDGASDPARRECNIGGIAGYNEATGFIENSQNIGAVSLTFDGGAGTLIVAQAGGIAGWNSNGATIYECNNSGAVSSEANASSIVSSIVHNRAGGITGLNFGGIIYDSDNAGNVSASSTVATSPGGAPRAEVFAGGIAGHNANIGSALGTIKNCYNDGSVDGTAAQSGGTNSTCALEVGGISGQNAGIIEDCYSTGAVTAAASNTVYGIGAGGITGVLYDPQALTRNCYNTGSVSAVSTGTNIKWFYGVGGIAGDLFGGGTVANCFNLGDVSMDSVLPAGDLGGVAGTNDGCTVIDCYWFEDADQTINSDPRAGAGIGSGPGGATMFDAAHTLDGAPITVEGVEVSNLLDALNAFVDAHPGLNAWKELGTANDGFPIFLTDYHTLSLGTADNGRIYWSLDGESFARLTYPVGFLPGTTVYLMAAWDEPYEFRSWTGTLSGSENPTSIVMDADAEAGALFEEPASLPASLPITLIAVTIAMLALVLLLLIGGIAARGKR
ncbi:MAG: hypothetical protein LBH69_02435 [Methanomassiliicoccaceae archaeon]|jgi:hypothetical protein|nr:hypothetical protein [Methanomassiliicoccaceae archaeon]